MRLHRSTRANAAWLPFLLFPGLITAYTIDCSKIVQDKYTWHLDKLGGVHTVTWDRETPPVWRNTTFSLDICTKLKKKEGECPSGTRVCGIERTIQNDGTSLISKIIPIAGDLEDYYGKPLDPKFTRLKGSGSQTDAEREGLRIELHGGVYNKKKQRASIDFLCPVGGKEPEPESDQEPDGERQKRGITDDGLTFSSYETTEPDYDTLFLKWETEYACESEKETKAHWGFFTWFLIIVFLVTAAYLIFGSWLNYNRYGARGWDLLPHGDTIRDVPYLLRDWTRRVLSTVQGGGSRGGYSAV